MVVPHMAQQVTDTNEADLKEFLGEAFIGMHQDLEGRTAVSFRPGHADDDGSFGWVAHTGDWVVKFVDEERGDRFVRCNAEQYAALGEISPVSAGIEPMEGSA